MVHGVFGAGKSHLLVCVLHFLQRALRGATRAGKPIKVLLAALTNVAVDNVLGGLIARAAEGEDPGVLRVGSLRRIAPAVLPHSTHGRLGADEEKATRRELERDLNGHHGARSTEAERSTIRQALAQIDSGKMAARARAVSKFSIVGATCAATALPCLEGVRFDIVLLDECSQLTEPASLVPIARMGCERLLAVGDPMQLPPTLHARTAPARAAAEGAPPPAHALDLTLFERLARCGAPPVLLAQQYRCHPQISALASRLFYGGRLRDGLGTDAARAARAPLLDGWSTIGFVEVSGAERVERGGSISNLAEAQRVVRLVCAIAAAGIEPARVGVICLYKAQAELCRRLLAETAEDLADAGAGVSTVDAFQGAERDVVLVSACRTARDADLRFISSPRRLNVTLTRARHHLVVVGHAGTLLGDERWAAVIGESGPLPECLLSSGGATAAGTAAPAVVDAGDVEEAPPPEAAAVRRRTPASPVRPRRATTSRAS